MSEEVEVGDHNMMKGEEEETDFTKISMMSLPEEMLAEIMNKLSSTDRAQCRLVSRAWYNSLCALYAQKETICITSLYEDCLDEVWRTLSKSARPLLHLEFRSLQLSRDGDGEAQPAFWRVCGSKILSLKLHSCKGTGSVFRNILEDCSNLQTLEFYFSSKQDMKLTLLSDGLGTIWLHKYVRNKLRNTSLRTLNIHLKDTYEPDANETTEIMWSYFYLEALCYLFTLFPCLSNFSSSQRDVISYYVNFRGDARQVNEEKALYYIAQLQEYFARDQMESIAIPCLGLNWQHWTSFMRVLSTRTTKITEIIILDSENWTLESFLEFSSRQTNIQKVTCVFSASYYTHEEFQEAVHKFFTLLQSVPSVRHLQLKKQYLPRLSSKKKIETTAKVVQCSRMNVSSKSFPVLANITSCNIESFHGENFDCVLRSLPNLMYLRLSHLNNATFESVCTNQHKLKSFIVDVASSEITSESMAGMVLFRNLMYLKVPERFVLQPHYLGNNLRFLQICDWKKWKFRDFDAPISFYPLTSPLLEVLRLDFDCTDCFPESNFCYVESELEIIEYYQQKKSLIISALANFPPSSGNLKHLYIKDGPKNLTAKDVSPIFQRNRSLRVLVISDSQIFFKHAIYNNCIIRKMEGNFNIHAIEFFEILRHFP